MAHVTKSRHRLSHALHKNAIVLLETDELRYGMGRERWFAVPEQLGLQTTDRSAALLKEIDMMFMLIVCMCVALLCFLCYLV